MKSLALWALLLFALQVNAGVDTPGPVRLAIDLPAGDAADSIRQLAARTGLQIIFRLDDLAGVHTRAVRGSYFPHEALDQLLEGTPLVAVPDDGSGAFAVTRRDGGQSGRPPVSSTSSKENPAADPKAAAARSPAESPMQAKPPLSRRILNTFVAIGLAATTSASGQEAADKDGASSEEDDVVTLSPFVVSTGRDVGFVAASSFAGGKMATDLKDTPLAYSVLTKEFLDTLAITDTETAMDWAVNSYQARSDAQDRIFNNDGGTRTRVRGVITKTLRNFFELGQTTDVYAQDRVDFARGTNALLVGNGGLGGATVLMTKQARFEKRSGELAFQISDQGAKRVTLDYNQPIGDKLAVRASLLLQDSDTWRDVGNDQRNGVYLTAAFRPWKKTHLRVDYEDYSSDEALAVNGLNDRVSGWDGVTVFAAPAASLTNSNALGVERLGSTTVQLPLMVPGYNNATVYNFANYWRTLGGGATTTTPVGGVVPVVTSNLRAAGTRINGFENTPVNRFDIATAKSKFFVTDPEYEFLPDMTTFSRFVENVSVYLDQQIGDDLFLQAAYSRTENGSVSNFLATRFTEVYVDVNQTLPGGAANPYFLEPYVETSRDDIGKGTNWWDELRGGLAYQKLNTRFGTFRVNVIAGTTQRDTDNRTYTHVMARNPDIRQRPVNDSMGFRYYLNDRSRPYSLPKEVTYVNPIAGTTETYPVEELLNIGYTDANNRTGRRNFDYTQASVFAKLFKDRLILLGGQRWDKFRVQVWNALHTNTRAAYPTDWDGRTLLFDPDAPENYWSLTGTQRAVYNPPVLEQDVSTVTYGGIINVTKWLGGFYNFAETYDTSRVVLAINGDVLKPTISSGWDAGIRFALAEGMINVSISKYSTTQTHSATGVDRNEIGILTRANARGDTSVDGINARGLGLVPQPYQDYQDAWAEGYEFEVVANLTKNWRLTCNYALPENYVNNRYPETWAYWHENSDTLRQIVLDTGAVIDPATDLASNPGIATSESPDITAAISNWNTMVGSFLPTVDANLPIVSTAYKYTANIYTDYKFTQGFLKNLRVGGGVQLRSKLQLGNRGTETIVNPANPLTAIDDPDVDANDLVYMEAWHMVTATLGYEMKLREKMRLSFNLNISNLLDRDEPIYTGAGLAPRNGDVTNPSRVMSRVGYYPNPRTISLTTRLSF